MGCKFSLFDSTLEQRPQGMPSRRRYSWSGSNDHTPTPFGNFNWLPKNKRRRVFKETMAPTWWDYRCEICEAVFMESTILDQHMRKVHSIAPKVKCPKCKAPFTKTANMTRHLNTKHRQDEPSFKCDICEKVLTTDNNLNRHIRLVHGRQKDFKCDECPAEFAEQQDLDKHIEKGKHYIEDDGRFCKQHLVFKSSRQRDLHYIRVPLSRAHTCRYQKYGKKDENGVWHL